MAKNRNSKKSRRNDSAAMDIADSRQIAADIPQAMDTSEFSGVKHHQSSFSRKMKKGVQMKRTKNVRKMKAMAKAVSLNEKFDEKILKNDSKVQRIQSAKKLYD